MAFLSGITDKDPVAGIFNWNMDAGRTISEWHQIVMRGESPLSVAERELIAAFTSGLNACPLCYGVHKIVAESFGISDDLIEKLVEDIDSAKVSDNMKPLLHFVKKLTFEPAKMVQADAEAVFSAGWSEQVLHDAINICCMFNFMNRIVMGHGGEQGDIGKHFKQLADGLVDGGYDQPLYTEAGVHKEAGV
ncbi:MAG: peroxidase-related enzyme [Gammaproteobacteria bacterium]|jgi:uncharacterized peroxidase-related enzyme|nr:peroxidase-related enzyme [Gammaproteobacteria bacterium]